MHDPKMIVPPFTIYLNGVEIADKNGHICTAENPNIARQIVQMLHFAALWQATEITEFPPPTVGGMED